MQLPKFLADLKFEQVMMILLTTIIAFCVVVQTINMREQARNWLTQKKETETG